MRTSSILLAGAVIAATVLVAPAASAQVRGSDGVIGVDDAVEGEAGAFIDVTYDNCGPLTEYANVQVIINGETDEGVQYALSDESLSIGDVQTFWFHAGSYSVTIGSGSFAASKNITVKDNSSTTVALSEICAAAAPRAADVATATPTATATTTATTTATVTRTNAAAAQVRTPSRIETGEAAAAGSTLRELGVGAAALLASILLAVGLVVARRQRSQS